MPARQTVLSAALHSVRGEKIVAEMECDVNPRWRRGQVGHKLGPDIARDYERSELSPGNLRDDDSAYSTSTTRLTHPKPLSYNHAMAAPKAPPALSYAQPQSDALLVSALRALPEDGRLRVRLRGISMSPFIRDGELAEVGRLPRQPRRGMVVVYTPDGKVFIMHRVIGCRVMGRSWQVRTKGDSVARIDGWWDASTVLGQVVALHSGGRRVPLDRGKRYWLGWLYSWVSPFSPIFYPVAWRLRSAFRKLIGLGSN